MYYDRLEAADVLVKMLDKYKDQKGIVLAVPRGGIPIACAIASSLNMPLDLVLTKKIGHPMNKEYAIGAVSLTGTYIETPELVGHDYVEQEVRILRDKLRMMYRKYMGDKIPESISGKIVIIVDDGIATGSTILASINMLRSQNPAKIVVAAPVSSKEAAEMISGEVDELIYPLVASRFYGVGQFYHDFESVTDEEVQRCLQKFHLDEQRKAA